MSGPRSGIAETGKLEQQAGRWVLRYERRLRHPPERVWRALTDAEDLTHWFPTAIEGQWKAGADLKFVFAEHMDYQSGGTVRICEPPRVLEYSWENELLRWELEPEGQGTLLRFIYTFDDRSVAARNGSGWHLCIDRLLARVHGQPPPAMDSWPEGYSVYSAALGLGDFPGFLQAASAVPGISEHAPGLLCTPFTGPGGVRLALCRATQDVEIAEYIYPADSYVAVTEGAFELRFHGGKVSLTQGMEFHIPNGLKHSGRASAGTRFILGLGVPEKKG